MDWSPNGTTIAVTIRRHDRTSQLGVVNAVDATLRVLKSPDWRGPTQALFAPDGRYAIFASDRTGSRDLWRQRMSDGARVGAPELAVPDIGNAKPLGVTSAGTLCVSRNAGGGNDIEVVSVESRKH